MRITELRAENIKRLKAIAIKPDGSLIVIGGKNGSGKTSLLDSIAMAIGGKDLVPAEPLRRGESRGEIEIKLDDGLVIKRTFTSAGGGTLTVSNKDGARHRTPQTLLDSLVGKLSFDPLAFSRMDPKAQAQTLRDLVGLDFSDIDAKRKAAFDQRTDVNREIKRIEGALEKMPAASGVDAAPASIEELAAELEKRRQRNAELRDESRKLEELRLRAVALKKEIADTEAKLAGLREQLEDTTAKGKERAAKVSAMQPADEAAVLEQIKNVEALNAAARVENERKRLVVEHAALMVRANVLSDDICLIDDHKKNQLAAAKMPIDGLAFDDSGVTLNGLPLDQASSAEQLRASVAIGLAMHPKLKVLLVRDGSLLDEQSLAMVAEMAAKAEAQVWVERVGRGDECAVIIEDGHVSVDAKAKPAPKLELREPGQD